MKLPIEPVIDLLHRAVAATLATHSVTLPGYPYATVVPNVADEHHRPVLYISALAEHTRNLLADPRVSLSIAAPDAANVQAAARLTLVGDAELFEPTEAQLARYLRYQPEAADYMELDFMFFRIQPRRVRFIEGVGKMGWFESGEWKDLLAMAPEEEMRLVEVASAQMPPGVRVLGVDAYGIDFEQGTRRARLSLERQADGASSIARLIGQAASATGG